MKSKQGGYGFVWFQDLSAAEQVVCELTNVVVLLDKNISVLLDIKFSKSTSSTIKSSGSKQQTTTAAKKDTFPSLLAHPSTSSASRASMAKPSMSSRLPVPQSGHTTSHSSLSSSPIANSPTSIATSSSVSSLFVPIYHTSESHGYPQPHSHMVAPPAPLGVQPSSSPSMMGPLPGTTAPLVYQPVASVPYPSNTPPPPPPHYLQQQYPIAQSPYPPSFSQNPTNRMVPMQLVQHPQQPHMTMMVMPAPMHFYAPINLSPPYPTHFISS